MIVVAGLSATITVKLILLTVGEIVDSQLELNLIALVFFVD